MLRLFIRKDALYSFELEDGEGIKREEFDFEETGRAYDCPECSETLFTGEDEAIVFLKGGK